jgi:glycosyltransferase involved in cell wall biosynthesis
MEPGNITQSPLHVLMASGVPRRREGGVAATIYNVGREIERRGHQVTYVFREDLMDPAAAHSRLDETVFAWRLARYIAKSSERFSVVDLHAPVGFVYGLLRKWNPRKHPPYVMTLHGLEERRVHVMSREEKKGRAWHFSRKNRLWHRAYVYPRFRWSIRTADGAHAMSRDVWNFLQLKYDLDAECVAYIANGVERRFFVPREYRSGERLRLLYAGSWLDQRGIAYLREALRELARKLPAMTMTFAGCGVPEKRIVDFFGAELARTIAVRPVVAAEHMPELYAEHDALLFPSLMEGLPSVLLEAMASGMPVITTETCGMPDVVEHRYNGMLIPPADGKAIECAVLELAASAELRERLGRAARETMTRYTWERSAGQLEALYRRVLEREAKAR